MQNITLLLHLLAAACLIGMYIPELLIKRAYRAQGDAPVSKLALASLHVRLMLWFFPVLAITVLLGVGRTFELHYPWLNFNLTLWLALKQALGFLMLVGYLQLLAPILKLSRLLRSDEGTDDERLRAYEKLRGRAHPFIMLAWVMAIFGVLKF